MINGIWILSALPFILLFNLHFWNYYVILRSYAREPPFKHFDLDFSRIPAQPPKTTRGKSQRPPAWPDPQTSHPHSIALYTISQLWPVKVISIPCCAIPRHHTPLEDIHIDLLSIVLVSVVVIFFVTAPPPSPSPHLTQWQDTSGRILTPPLSCSRRHVPIVSSTLAPPHRRRWFVFIFVFIVVVFVAYFSLYSAPASYIVSGEENVVKEEEGRI